MTELASHPHLVVVDPSSAVPRVINQAVLQTSGVADVSNLSLPSMVKLFLDHLTSTAAAAHDPIDRDQAHKFLSHMVRSMTLGPEELVLMKVFYERFEATFSSSTLPPASGRPTTYVASTSSSPHSSPPRLTTGMKLLLACYNAQALVYDEPLAKSTWTLYSRMSWDEFVHELFSFNTAIDFALSVSPAEFNATAWTLVSGSPPPSPSRGASFSLASPTTPATTTSPPPTTSSTTTTTTTSTTTTAAAPSSTTTSPATSPAIPASGGISKRSRRATGFTEAQALAAVADLLRTNESA